MLTMYRQTVSPFIKKARQNTRTIVQNHPRKLLAGVAAMLIVLVLLGSWLQQEPKDNTTDETQAVAVSTYHIGESPKIQVLAEVTKENVVTIVAQKPGVVQKIYVTEGDHVPHRGKTLVYLSDTYSGGNASSLQRQIAQKQYENSRDTLQSQLDVIAKQKELARLQETNDDQLREIQEENLEDLGDQLNRNEDLLNLVNQAQADLPASQSAGLDQYDQLQVQLKSANDQLRSQIRQVEYQVDDDNPPGELADLQRDLTTRQLEIQEKSIQLGAEISELQYRLAQIQESLAYPTSVSNGDIELVHVHEGQYVQPGTPLVTMKGCDDLITASITTSQQVSQSVTTTSAATFHFPQQTADLYPQFISSEPVAEGSYIITFAIPASYDSQIGNGQLVRVDLPVGLADTSATVPFVPLEGVYLSNHGAYLFLYENGIAKVREVEAGDVFGRFVQITQGLESADQVILSRNVIDGQAVTVNQN